MPTLSIRNMKIDNLNLVMSWTIEEGWNVGHYDAKFYLSADLSGYKMLLLDENQLILSLI